MVEHSLYCVFQQPILHREIETGIERNKQKQIDMHTNKKNLFFNVTIKLNVSCLVGFFVVFCNMSRCFRENLKRDIKNFRYVTSSYGKSLEKVSRSSESLYKRL